MPAIFRKIETKRYEEKIDWEYKVVSARLPDVT